MSYYLETMEPELTEACDFTLPDKKWAYPFVPRSLVRDTRGTNASFNFKEIMIGGIMLLAIASFAAILWLANRIRNPRRRAQVIMGILFVAYVVWVMNPEIHIFLLLFFTGVPQTLVLRSPPILNAAEAYPYSKEFEKAHPEIKEEILYFSEHLANAIPFIGEIFTANKGIGSDSDTEGDARERKGWRSLILKLGDVIEENCTKFGMETLCELIRDRPEIYTASVSVLDGGKNIPLHQGYYKGVTRMLFPVVVPEPKKTHICINGMEYHWAEGKTLLFDDMFVHEVHNGSDKRRIMIYMDVARPSKNGVYNNINKLILDKSIGLEYNQRAKEKASLSHVQFDYLNPATNFHPPREKAPPPIGPYHRHRYKEQPSPSPAAPSTR
jgi:hypothetical protein